MDASIKALINYNAVLLWMFLAIEIIIKREFGKAIETTTLMLTLQWVSCISSAWNIYPVTKQINNPPNGKNKVTRQIIRSETLNNGKFNKCSSDVF